MDKAKVLKKNRIRRSSGDIFVQGFIYCCLVLLTLAIVLPCWHILILAFNDGKDAAHGGVFLWPRQFTLANFRDVFRDGSIMNAYSITILRTFIGTLLSLVITSMAAFALRERRLPARSFILFAITFCMLFSGGLIPNYILYNKLGLLDTFWVYIFPGAMSVTYLMMMRSTMDGIPNSLIESAELDGCGFMRTYLKIVLPLSKPVLAVVGLYTAVNHWNDWFSGSFYMTSTKLWPVQTVLQQMLTRAMSAQQEVVNISSAMTRNATTVTSDSLKMAAVVLTVLPILCVYPFIQKYFAKGVMIGAVKG